MDDRKKESQVKSQAQLVDKPKSVSVISNGDKRMQALKVPLYPYHEVINYTNNLITFFNILRSISCSG